MSAEQFVGERLPPHLEIDRERELCKFGRVEAEHDLHRA